MKKIGYYENHPKKYNLCTCGRYKTIKSKTCHKCYAKKIIQLDKKGEELTRWDSAYQLWKLTQGKYLWQTIGKALNGKRKTAYGFKWKYV